MKRRWLYLLIAIAALLFLLLAVAGPIAQAMWFVNDAGYLRVFTLPYTAQGTLFTFAFVPTLILWWIAFSGVRGQQALFTLDPSSQFHQIALFVNWLQRQGSAVSKWASFILALLCADGFAGNWRDMLLATHGVPFGRTDPIFGLDLSFFVFVLPWLDDIVSYALLILFGCILVSGITKVIKDFLAQQMDIKFASKQNDPVRPLTGAFLVVLAAQILISMFQSESAPGDLFTGPGLAGMVGLRMTYALVVLTALGGLYLLVLPRRHLNVKTGFIAVGPAFAWYVIGVLIIPAVVQRFQVVPDMINAEQSYAQRALTATKFAYGIDKINAIQTAVHDAPTPAEIQSAASTFQNMRLWDPQVLESALEATQSFRPYYTFSDVDIDRYMLPDAKGKMQETMLMLSPRDIYLPGLSGEAQTWVNTRLAYTHGYGIAAAEVNKSNSMGQPSLVASDIPQTSLPNLPVGQPRLYFSDFRRADGSPADEYAVVDTKVNEMDYPTLQGQAVYKWTGQRGIELNSVLKRILFSYDLGDWNLLISKNIKSSSRLIWHRNVLERAQMVYPFLTFDGDPYIAVVDGQIYWILDGYTTSNSVPYSRGSLLHSQAINYVRNSAKVVINAYSGEMHAYEVGAPDPILRTYERIYPGLIRPNSEVPAGIAAHFRYPEDLLAVQSGVLTNYHVDSATTFLENSDAWAIANERGLQGDKAQIQPYYLIMRLPDEPRDEFLLILPFTPLGRDNMVGWLAAHCDGDRYGQLTLYTFPKGALVNGPAQAENLFVQDRTIADINRNYNNDQSEIIVGNLLAIPVGTSMVYCESLFLQSRTTGIQSIPELKKVILALKDKIVVANTYQDAVDQLFGQGVITASGAGAQASTSTSNGTASGAASSQSSSTGQNPSSGASSLPMVNRSLLQKADADLDAAQQALKQGDLGKYGDLVKQASADLKKAIKSQ